MTKMGASTIENPKAYARFAGLNYLIIFALAIYANFFVIMQLVVSGDPGATAENVMQQEALFRVGVACLFVVMIADVFIAWSLYYVMRPVHEPLALLSAFFRLVYTVAQIGVLLNFSKLLQLSAATPLEGAAAQGLGPHFWIGAHANEFTLTLIFFGLHLLLLGWLVLRSSFLPTVIGALVMVAGLGYVGDGFAAILFDGYGPLGAVGVYVVVVPALIGEGALMLWLLIVGLNAGKWRESQTARALR